MAKPRNPPTTPVETPEDLPLEDPTTEEQSADGDPDLLDEPADGGGVPRLREVPIPAFDMRPSGESWQQDPFAMLAKQEGFRIEEPQQAVVPTPGSTRAVTEEDLARRGMVEYPDDALVTVKLWEVNDAGVAGDAIMRAESVLYSVAREPLTWIEYSGKWYMEIISSGKDKKKLVKKTFSTPGPPPPRNPNGSLAWRPKIEGGDSMDRSSLINELISLGLIKPGMTQQAGLPVGAYPAGSIPQSVADDRLGELRGQVSELKAEVKSLTKEKDEAKEAKNEALRRQENAERDLRQADKDIKRLEDEVRDLKHKIENAPRGDGKPEWVHMAEFMRDTGKDPDKVTLKDLMKFMADRDEGRGSTDPFQALNSSLELVDKVRRTAGLPGATPTDAAKSEEWTLEKVVGVADKVTDIVKRRQRMAEIEHGASSSASGGGAKREKTQAERDKEALENTIEKLVNALRAQEDPDKLGRKLAAAVAWASELDMADVDPEIKGFLTELYKNPAKLLPWYGAHQDPPIPEAYCLRVAVAFSKAINRPVESAAPPKPEPAPSKPQDAPQPPPAAGAAPMTKAGRPRRKPGRKPKAPKNGGQEAKAEEAVPETHETPPVEEKPPAEAAVQS